MRAHWIVTVACLAAACTGTRDEATASRAAVARPDGVAIAPGGLADALANAEPGAVLCLEPGVHDGPLKIERSVTIWGPPDAVVRSQGRGTTIAVDAPNVRLLGFTVDGSGSRFDKTDAAVRVRADDVEVRGLSVERALFGILVELAKRVSIVENSVEGLGQKAFGLRGDGIRFWEVEDSEIRGNRVRDARDVVVWYSSRNTIRDNDVRGCRYGTHFMYSNDTTVEDNSYRENVVGVFVMYSRDVALRRNLIVRCSGAAGIGLGVKESGNLEVIENAFLANTTSVYLDTSPLDRTHTNRFEGNQFRMSETGIAFHASPHRNVFESNTLRDNTRQVHVGGGGSAKGAEWRGNSWDDYQGYDLDRDGTGDVPYALRSLSSDLLGKEPDLAFLRGAPALSMVDLVGHVMPLFGPRELLVDREPRMTPLELEWLDAD